MLISRGAHTLGKFNNVMLNKLPHFQAFLLTSISAKCDSSFCDAYGSYFFSLDCRFMTYSGIFNIVVCNKEHKFDVSGIGKALQQEIDS